MKPTAEKHDEYLGLLKAHLEGHCNIVVKVNCRYDPVERKLIAKGRRDSRYEYDMIGFAKATKGFDPRHPVLFVEYTHHRHFNRQKFTYEAWRWHWFCQSLIASGAVPEALLGSDNLRPTLPRRRGQEDKLVYDPPTGPPPRNLPYLAELPAARRISDECSRLSAVPLFAVWRAKTARRISGRLESNEFLPVKNIETVLPAKFEECFAIPDQPHYSIYGD